ncbi:right-handed parallel beta-helix repeat-containing protein [Natronorubrum sp. DTA7]|uniref:right-handed parallel beta-helix repeat-containing protein n=1 Tax=Natronorubrum sp. DTA7 TaxID=3447016 RepID=UPI003F831749
MVFSILLVGSIIVPFTDVSRAASDHGDCVGPGESIQAAIDGASVGDTICIEAGTYEEEVTIGQNAAGETLDGLTLVAAAGQSPVLSGSGTGTGVHIDGAATVTVEGLEIREYGTAVRVEDSPNATIKSNTITENDQAIRDFDTPSHDMVIVDNVIEQNPIRGISVQGSDRVQMTGNHIEANGKLGFRYWFRDLHSGRRRW